MSSYSKSSMEQWWGVKQFELNQSKIWQLGSLQLKLTRYLTEWRLEYHRPALQYEYEQKVQQIFDHEYQLPLPVEVNRYMFKHTESNLHLMPRLAPRSIVIKPIEPIYLSSGQSTMLYISTPLWLRVYRHRAENALFELPIVRTKETWFGANRREGEICYMASVDGHTDLSLLTPCLLRAVTPIFLQNLSARQLHFDRMNIPVMALPLFYSESIGRLVTSQIRVSYENDNKPRIRIDQRSPDFAGDVQHIHAAHENTTLFNMFELF